VKEKLMEKRSQVRFPAWAKITMQKALACACKKCSLSTVIYSNTVAMQAKPRQG